MGESASKGYGSGYLHSCSECLAGGLLADQGDS